MVHVPGIHAFYQFIKDQKELVRVNAAHGQSSSPYFESVEMETAQLALAQQQRYDTICSILALGR